MTHRERFFNRISGKPVDCTPFFPDISMWYQWQRYGDDPNWPKVYPPGGIIPPDAEINQRQGIMPERYKAMNLFQIARDVDFGIPIHGYGIFMKTAYKTVKITTETSGKDTTTTYTTPKGVLQALSSMADDHSSCTREFMVKSPDDFPILEYIINDREYTADYARAQKAIDTVGDQGYVNMVVGRSPMGHLVHDYMGIEQTTFALFDAPEKVARILQVLDENCQRIWPLVAASPGKSVYLCDNMDEFLIAPEWYRDYFLPYYQRFNEYIHGKSDKKTLTHMDGRMTNLLPMVKDNGFDVLDGCTPAPMNDFEPRTLRAALASNQYAYCGVPSPFFIQRMEEGEILDFAKRIIDDVNDRLILNVGDIMPNRGDMEMVRKIAELARTYGAC